MALSIAACGGSAPEADITDADLVSAQANWDRSGSLERDQACGFSDCDWPPMGKNADERVQQALVVVRETECAERATADEEREKRNDESLRARDKWAGLQQRDQDSICASLAEGDEDGVRQRFTRTENEETADRFIAIAMTVCEARASTAESEEAEQEEREQREAQAAAQRERQRKIDVMISDSSLTDDQKVAVYDAVCEYLTTPGADGDLLVLSETAEAALPADATPQQVFDASVAAGYLMGISECR